MGGTCPITLDTSWFSRVRAGLGQQETDEAVTLSIQGHSLTLQALVSPSVGLGLGSLSLHPLSSDLLLP